ncbi:MAG: SDR family NAD(P)-dependent oxidoreductase [candidate division Zixibacteria bacterium]|nr:SDR family NAD(P)-dependent oxidoreductase [candidate division Zixibacteria bacterium]
MAKKVLVTGANGGFGKLITLTLLKKGHTVVASIRGVNGKNKPAAEELKKAGAHIVEIDVAADGSVLKGVEQAIQLAGGLDVVVNNAGVGVLGLQEAFTPEDWKKLFDINVFGVQRVSRAVLPNMRSKKSGLLIQISSLLGRMTIPFYGPYNASKWAVEALAENYRTELSGFGIDSCIVEPGGYPTTFIDNLVKPSDTSRNANYGDFVRMPVELLMNYEKALAANPEQNPQNVADAVARLIDTPAGQRPFRTVVDKMGMGEHIKGYNDHLEQVTAGVYNAFGIGEMLKLKV